MIGPLIVFALFGAPAADVDWVDVPLERVREDAPVLTRVFQVPQGRVEELAEIASLFGDRLRFVATSDRLVVVGSAPLLDHLARVAELCLEPWQEVPGHGGGAGEAAEPREAARPTAETRQRDDPLRETAFREAITEAMQAEELTYSDFSRSVSRRTRLGTEVRQKVVLTPAPRRRLVRFAAHVAEHGHTRVASVQLRKVSRDEEGAETSVATFEFVLCPERATERLERFLDFQTTFDELRQRLDSAGVTFDLMTVTLNLEGRIVARTPADSPRLRFSPSQLLITSPDPRAHLAIGNAFSAEDSRFSASALSRPQADGYRVNVTLEPRPGPQANQRPSPGS